MNPGNRIRGYEALVLVLGAVSVGITATLAAAPSLGVSLAPAALLIMTVANAVIPFLTNRLDALGEPQGANYVSLVDSEGKTLNPGDVIVQNNEVNDTPIPGVDEGT